MHLGIKLPLLALLWVAAFSAAQDVSSPFDRIPGCDRPNSSRLPSEECGFTVRAPVIIRHELESTTQITIPEINSLDCQAKVSISYLQAGAVARVEGMIENESCAASSGSFVVSVSTRDESGELKTQEFPQSWQRDDDQPVTFSEDYEIGENVDLGRVRALRVQCKCDNSE